MKYIKILILIILTTIAIKRSFDGWIVKSTQKQAHLNENLAWQEVVYYAQEHLPAEGQLMVKSDGFVYLKVDDAYIHTLFPMLGLEQDGYQEPPYFRTKEAPGAHISVFYADEHIRPEEVGQHFHFELKHIELVRPSKNASYAILVVESPELEKLREKYGLSAKLFGHEYHIALAKKQIRRTHSYRK